MIDRTVRDFQLKGSKIINKKKVKFKLIFGNFAKKNECLDNIVKVRNTLKVVHNCVLKIHQSASSVFALIGATHDHVISLFLLTQSIVTKHLLCKIYNNHYKQSPIVISIY